MRSSRARRTTDSVTRSAIEEFPRWASPVYHFRRTATRDVELGGKQVGG
jgi:cytochrome P450